MNVPELHIPKISVANFINIYRSDKPEDINTIAKVKDKLPIMVISQEEAVSVPIQPSGEGYIVRDRVQTTQGIVYNGPAPKSIPCHQYEMDVEVEMLNKYSYNNIIKFTPLPLRFNGKMFYYSIIGIDTTGNEQCITHLSKVRGLMLTSDWELTGIRHIWARDDENDDWKFFCEFPWNQEIKLGSVHSNKGIPYVETPKVFEPNEVKIMTRMVSSSSFMVMEIPNVWQKDNRKYNQRKLKQFKIQNTVGNLYGEFSEPSFQSELPVHLDRIIIQRKQDWEEPNTINPLQYTYDNEVKAWEIVRKHGKYYDYDSMKKLPTNPFRVEAGIYKAVFTESSTQETIKIQMPAMPGHKYNYTIYTQDLYGKVSTPLDLEVTT